MKAVTTRRALFATWTETLCMKWTRPGGVHHLGDRRLDAFVGVGDHELDAAQASSGGPSQEAGPEGLGLRGADLQTQHLAPAIAVGTHRSVVEIVASQGAKSPTFRILRPQPERRAIAK
jgi:hypothetical protein